MNPKNYPHLIIPYPPAPEPFTSARGGGGKEPRSFSGDRARHGERLLNQYNNAIPVSEQPDTRGMIISFRSFPGLELALNSLENQSQGEQPQLVSVTTESTCEGQVQVACVYVPYGKRDYMIKKITDYMESVSADKPKNANLIEGIASIRRATIRELWTDPSDQFPKNNNETRWWEVWLRRNDGDELERFKEFASRYDLRIGDHYLGFQDRTVLLVRATMDQLSLGLNHLDDLAELRRPHEIATFLASLPPKDQREWVDDLLSRLRPSSLQAPAVCVLDTGVQKNHPLLRDSLADEDVRTTNPDKKVDPKRPHGTEMAGLALYRDLQEALASSDQIQLDHRLESVKILPDRDANNPDLYGAITAAAVDQAETQTPDRRRTFMMAVTAPADEEPASEDSRIQIGKPTSWSAAIDALAFGRAVNSRDGDLSYINRDGPRRPRLFIVSAGNISPGNPAENYLDRCDVSPVEDPAQAWNALTVGAYTDNDDMSHAPEDFAGYIPVAPRGDLCPLSRTSVLHGKNWPFKPEVVADGGNIAVSADRTAIDTPPNLRILTTRLRQHGIGGYLTTTNATSAATAQVAAIAGSIMAAYPSLRPEAVRALIVHSATWTPRMHDHFKRASKKEIAALIRRYGMGVPRLDRALRSAADALTLISQATIRPFEGGSSVKKVREMNLHELPWPQKQLESLGSTQVRLRVTLSYFIEPNPSNRGWNGRYAYPSYGLRFSSKRQDESLGKFRERINKRSRTPNTVLTSHSVDKNWLLGADQQQKPGSLHTDIWIGPAIDLANKNAIAVYPVGGWWKSRPTWDQSDSGVDYALIVSIEAPDIETDLWTPVSQQIGTPTEIVI